MSRLNDHQRCAHAVRVLGLAAIEQARSGHPGVVLGFADVLTVLWREHMRYDVTYPEWPARDRFVLSNGHASALYYAVLHCVGFDLSLHDLRQFRQLGSKTPGHPERDVQLGIDVTTGPLGQGLANAVGIAMAEHYLCHKTKTQKPQSAIQFHTYAAVGDGCLMEGISHEACSLAGRLGLGRLIVCWDDNDISIDGRVDQWAEKSVVGRFQSYGWQVIDGVDGHDPEAINHAITQAKSCQSQPSLICFKTRIGLGTDWEGTAQVHGKPLGEKRFSHYKQSVGWALDDFTLTDDVYGAWRQNVLASQRDAWSALSKQILDPYWADYFASYTDGLSENNHHILPSDWEDQWAAWLQDDSVVSNQPTATRHSSQSCLAALVEQMPSLIGGSADLAESTGVSLPSLGSWDPCGEPSQFIHFGVREFAMFAIANGLATCCGLRPFVSTFLVFSDYGINAVRMAALMNLPVIFIFSHDSVFVGEDGPTHQPIEHLAHLRSIPQLEVWRPADAQETAVAWKSVLERTDGPSCMVLTRQKLMPIDRGELILQCYHGASRLDAYGSECHGLLIATGSEVNVAVQVQQRLAQEGLLLGVISMLCLERFLGASDAFKKSILTVSGFRMIIEAGSSSCWYQLLQGMDGCVCGIDHFGTSGNGEAVYHLHGFSVDALCEKARQLQKQVALI